MKYKLGSKDFFTRLSHISYLLVLFFLPMVFVFFLEEGPSPVTQLVKSPPAMQETWVGFPDSSVGKESACSAGDPGSILQYSWASIVAQLVKNLPAMREIWVQSLGWEDLLEKGKATNYSILAWGIPWTV